MKFYTVESLGASQELTPEGFLLARDVRIARTGAMLYAAGEVPVEPTRDGIIRIERLPEEVFRPETIASFEGKPITLDHPGEEVTPANWTRLAKGLVHNVRRGSGFDSDYLIANLLIMDAQAIASVRGGLREVSAGYEAAYEQVRPGSGIQHDIVGNHVALVTIGRCGSRCAIGDSVDLKKWKDKLGAAFKANDSATFEAVLAEETAVTTTDATRTTLDSILARLVGIDSRLVAVEKKAKTRDAESDEETEEEKKKRLAKEKAAKEATEDEETEEEKKKRLAKEAAAKSTEDSGVIATLLREEMQDAFARAEILAPGLRLPTLDATAKPTVVRDSLCALRRKALATAYDGSGKEAIAPFVKGKTPDFAAMTCDAVSTIFVGASEILKRENNSRSAYSLDAGERAGKARSAISEINKANAEAWKR